MSSAGDSEDHLDLLAEEHWVEQVYATLAMHGVDPSKIVPNFETSVRGTDANAVIAIPETRIAVATDGDTPGALGDDDDEWVVEFLSVGELRTFARVAAKLRSVAIEHLVRASAAAMIKAGSSEESRLLDAILRANLPVPHRNYQVMHPGTKRELAVPDFTWPERRVAFFMDGLWWHHGKDSDMHMKIAAGTADKAVLEQAQKGQLSRATRDAANRSELALMGWTVLSCTDEDLATDEGVARKVSLIRRALRESPEAPQSSQDLGGPKDEDALVRDLFELPDAMATAVDTVSGQHGNDDQERSDEE